MGSTEQWHRNWRHRRWHWWWRKRIWDVRYNGEDAGNGYIENGAILKKQLKAKIVEELTLIKILWEGKKKMWSECINKKYKYHVSELKVISLYEYISIIHHIWKYRDDDESMTSVDHETKHIDSTPTICYSKATVRSKSRNCSYQCLPAPIDPSRPKHDQTIIPWRGNNNSGISRCTSLPVLISS